MIISRQIKNTNENIFIEYFDIQLSLAWIEIQSDYRNNLLKIDNRIKSTRYKHHGIYKEFRKVKKILEDNDITFAVTRDANYKFSLRIYIEDRIFPVDFKEDRFFIFPRNERDIMLIEKELKHLFNLQNIDNRIIQLTTNYL